jgi:hypothetical protein
MNKIPVIGLAISALLYSSLSVAEGIGVGVKAGTLGLGIEVTKGFTSTLNGRIGFNAYTFDASGTESDIDYDSDWELKSVALLLDWHPFSGGFRTTVGVFLNDNKIDSTAKTESSYDIGGTTYTAAQVGTLAGNVSFNDTAPYVGIGWGNAVGKGQRLTFALDVGVLVQGAPNAELTSTGGTLSSDPNFQANLATEEAELQDSLDDFDLYPVISVGLAFQF